MIGQRFGLLVVIGSPLLPVSKAKARAGFEEVEVTREPRWRVRCDCGTGTLVRCGCGMTVEGLDPLTGEPASEPCWFGEFVVTTAQLAGAISCGCVGFAAQRSTLPPAPRCLIAGCPGTASRFPGHLLAAHLCIGHVLDAIRKPRCLAPDCARAVAEVGAATARGLLCPMHVDAVALTHLEMPPGPPRPDLRGRCTHPACSSPSARRPTWNYALTGRTVAVSTPAGEWCLEHLPPQPAVSPPSAARTAGVLAPPAELLAATVAVMRGLAATPLRTEPTYGDLDESAPAMTVAGRLYTRPPSRARTVSLDDDRVPGLCRTAAAAALAAGWSVLLRAANDPASVLLRAWLGPLQAVARWDGGELVTKQLKRGPKTTWQGASYETGWLQVERGLPTRLTATELTDLFKPAARSAA